MSSLLRENALEFSATIDYAIELAKRDNKPYSVIYSDNLQQLLPMPAEPCPSQWGWDIITTVAPP